jgi:hypothetical protein
LAEIAPAEEPFEAALRGETGGGGSTGAGL